MKKLRDNWPLAIALTLLWAIVALTLLRCLARNDGHLVYSLDDTYIHMALAKHLVRDHVWGVTKYEFSSSQSSLVWPLLIALFYLPAGPNEWAPLVLNIILATALLWYLYVLFKRAGLPGALNLFLLLVTVVLAPLLLMVFDGMEHVLQTLASLAFVHSSAQILSSRSSRRRTTVLLLGLALLLPAVRYDGLFLIASVVPLFWLRRRWLAGVAVPALAVLPMVAYGVVASAHGAYWLPNSVLLKSHYIGVMQQEEPVSDLLRTPLIYMMAPAALLYAVRRRAGFWDPGQLMLLVFLVASLLQAFVARIIPTRYISYLLTLGMYAVVTSLYSLPGAARVAARWRAWATAGAMAMLVAIRPGPPLLSWRMLVPWFTSNIYQQQYQMARFLREYYQGQGVAANDIGVITYMADVRLLDIVGLGTPEVARARMNRAYSSALMDRLARDKGIRVAVVYRSWLFDVPGLHGPPRRWVEVGRWRIPYNVICGDDTVNFYAVDPSEAPRLRQHLEDFATRLPPQVEQTVS